MPTKWESYKDAPPEVQEAFETLDKVTTKEPEKKVSLTKSGRKKFYGKTQLPPFEGATQEESDQIRVFLACEYSGFSHDRSAEEAGCDRNHINILKRRLPKAWEEAETALVKASQERYHRNLWIIRTALTEAGPRAVRTVCDLMDNPQVPPATRLKAAIAMLKLANVDGSAAHGSEELKSEIAGAIRDARKEIKSDRIIDAEEAEVIDDGDL